MDFIVSGDYRGKIERKRIDKFKDFTREPKNLWNMKVTVIPVVDGVLRRLPEGPEKRLDELWIRGRIKTIHTTALQKSAKILRKVLVT